MCHRACGTWRDEWEHTGVAASQGGSTPQKRQNGARNAVVRAQKCVRSVVVAAPTDRVTGLLLVRRGVLLCSFASVALSGPAHVPRCASHMPPARPSITSAGTRFWLRDIKDESAPAVDDMLGSSDGLRRAGLRAVGASGRLPVAGAGSGASAKMDRPAMRLRKKNGFVAPTSVGTGWKDVCCLPSCTSSDWLVHHHGPVCTESVAECCKMRASHDAAGLCKAPQASIGNAATRQAASKHRDLGDAVTACTDSEARAAPKRLEPADHEC